ncbi:MAG: 16S rRNA (guanine(527)-N(7))-methyltransferase RsmG [Oscillospiraceae bacterium]|nr:16S rRNA (guanine(527)-N(7))-methyltransferase RsmG [Candidatus Equicaccousia limihippi]
MKDIKPQLDIYKQLLLRWNQSINLTAIKDPDEIDCKHFEDSLTVLSVLDIPHGARFIDIGTGAGFPGMVLKIARPDLDMTLLDSRQKRFLFLEDLQKTLGISCTNTVHRAEEITADERESYDFATSRAVAKLNLLCEYALPYLKVGGHFIAYKANLSTEIEDCGNALKILGGEIEAVKSLKLSDGSERNLVIIKKISQTPTKYPRVSAQIAKRPL